MNSENNNSKKINDRHTNLPTLPKGLSIAPMTLPPSSHKPALKPLPEPYIDLYDGHIYENETQFFKWLYYQASANQIMATDYFSKANIQLYFALTFSIGSVEDNKLKNKLYQDDFSRTIRDYGIELGKPFDESINKAVKEDSDETKYERTHYVYTVFVNKIFWLLDEGEIPRLLKSKETFSTNRALCGRIDAWLQNINDLDRHEVIWNPRLLQAILLQYESIQYEIFWTENSAKDMDNI